ncbi:hypothetical protein AB1Y20_016954 [Prymnesium parvum]|uniref:Peroxisome membrane anchor protein Pex14p N-terminal domain-containing protein n=1 Tax=Prymnesium parvum TaxID=97485 RepID=A0AB34ICF3_PRYPA
MEVSQAVSFLRHPKTQQTPLAERLRFLRAKGLTEETIAEALRQTDLAPPPAAASRWWPLALGGAALAGGAAFALRAAPPFPSPALPAAPPPAPRGEEAGATREAQLRELAELSALAMERQTRLEAEVRAQAAAAARGAAAAAAQQEVLAEVVGALGAVRREQEAAREAEEALVGRLRRAVAEEVERAVKAAWGARGGGEEEEERLWREGVEVEEGGRGERAAEGLVEVVEVAARQEVEQEETAEETAEEVPEDGARREKGDGERREEAGGDGERQKAAGEGEEAETRLAAAVEEVGQAWKEKEEADKARLSGREAEASDGRHDKESEAATLSAKQEGERSTSVGTGGGARLPAAEGEGAASMARRKEERGQLARISGRGEVEALAADDELWAAVREEWATPPPPRRAKPKGAAGLAEVVAMVEAGQEALLPHTARVDDSPVGGGGSGRRGGKRPAKPWERKYATPTEA